VAGPPITQRFEISVSHESIRAEMTSYGLQVSLNTSLAGYVVGWVRLEGLTGSATIRVTAEILASTTDRSQHQRIRRRKETADPNADPNIVWVYRQRRLARARFSRTVLSFLWALIPILSFGIVTPLPIILAAVRFRRRSLWIAAALYVATSVLFIVLLIRTEDSPSGTEYDIGTVGYFIVMIAAIIHAFFLRKRYFGLNREVYEPG
jgi:hypothetical protein